MKALIILQCIFIIGSVSAQTPNATPQPLPSGPLIQMRAPKFSRWTVTYIPSKVANVPAENRQSTATQRRKQLIVNRTKDVRFSQMIDEGGQSEKWHVGNFVFIIDPVTQRLLVYKAGYNKEIEPETDFSETDFPGFEWISLQNYVNIQNVMGHDCIVFNKGSGPEAIAYIDLKTRLPLLLQKDNETCVYQFDTPPQAELILPADVQETLDFNKRHVKELMCMPQKPF